MSTHNALPNRWAGSPKSHYAFTTESWLVAIVALAALTAMLGFEGVAIQHFLTQTIKALH
jgi:hypothetical protein